MSLAKKIRSQFYKTPIFKGLVNDYTKRNRATIVSKSIMQKKESTIKTLQKTVANTTKELASLSQSKVELEQKIPAIVKAEVESEVQKVQLLQKKEAMQYRYPARVNSQSDPDRKYLGDIPFSYLRRMAQVYPIARACINRRITQITQLEWNITTVDKKKDEKGFETQIATAKQFFKSPIGHKSRLRELLTIMVDDLLTIDAVCFEMQRTRGGEFMHIIPVDPTTIALKVTDTGRTPEPPETAYRQIIAGQTIAEFTTDEMIYDFMHNRSYSPYGLAPLESLILQVESAIYGALYNLNYFRENNIPEGFITLPEDVVSNKDRVEEWQVWFDSLLAGDARMVHRLKILPGGAEYTPAKKPEDMAFERFEMWLLQQTCAMFDIQPQDIGITYQVNKATSETQNDIGRERGLLPLGNFLKEIFDDIVQIELGFPQLQWVWLNINPVDRKQEVEIAEKEINMGALGVDEYRTEHGREPLGLKPYIKTSTGPLLVEDVVAGNVGPAADAKRADTLASQPKDNGNGSINNNQSKNGPSKKGEMTEDEEDAMLELRDIRNWRKAIMKDFDLGRELRTRFPSQYIRPEVHKDIQDKLLKSKNKFEATLVFEQYIDPELRASMTLLKYSQELRRQEHAASA